MAENSVKKVVTRFAPSPTGFLHIGGARTALFNYLYAKKYGGKFILRIEDTDLQRNSAEASEAILKSMKWLGLSWDEGPFYQSERLDSYRRYALKMLDGGLAYRCFCTTERLETMRRELSEKNLDPKYDGDCLNIAPDEAAARAENGECHVIRFKMPQGKTIIFNDMVHGELSFNSDTLDDFVILKSDGMPTYNFAVAIDDHEMGITNVIRGDDHISNTPKQIAILNSLGITPPEYGHVPMILGGDKAKLSKRHGATSLTWYEEAGYVREAVVNYLSLLGWSYDATTEFFTLNELIEKFSAERLGKTPSVFDIVKLNHFNQLHLKAMDIDAKTALVMEFLKTHAPGFKYEEKYFTREYIKNILMALGDRLKLLTDFPEWSAAYLNDSMEYSQEMTGKLKKDFTSATAIVAISCIIDILSTEREFTAAALEAQLRSQKIEGVNFSKLVFLIRSAMTGKTASPGIFDVLVLLGRERCVARMQKFSGELERLLA